MKPKQPKVVKVCDMAKHDFSHPIRLGRAHYVCEKCREDITLILVLLEAVRITKSRKKKK